MIICHLRRKSLNGPVLISTLRCKCGELDKLKDFQATVLSVSSENSSISVTATNEELQHIRNTFKNIPIVSEAESVCWGGETAKFILMNLKHVLKKK